MATRSSSRPATYSENVTVTDKAITIDGDTSGGAVNLNGQITVAGTLNGAFKVSDIDINATGKLYGVFARISVPRCSRTCASRRARSPSSRSGSPRPSTSSSASTCARRSFVHQLSVHTVGGVINNGEVIMQIVPRADELVVEAKVAPSDIDQIATGSTAIV